MDLDWLANILRCKLGGSALGWVWRKGPIASAESRSSGLPAHCLGHRCAQFRADSPTVNIRRTISSFSSNKDRNMIKTCLANNVYFPVKQNLSYEDLLIKDNELPPYLPKGMLNIYETIF